MLKDLIHNLNKEEIRHLKIWLSRSHNTGERKDIELFDLFKASKEEEEIFKKLYPGSNNKNSYYRLKNRLQDDVFKSLWTLNLDKSEWDKAFMLLSVAKKFSRKNLNKLAHNILVKAERTANKIEAFDLLELIYGEQIKVANDLLDINPEEFIEKRKLNRQSLEHLGKLDDSLAVLTYRIRKTINYAKSNEQINDILNETINEINQDESLKGNHTFRFKMYHAVSKMLLQKHDYVALENYLIKTFNDFKKEGLFSKNRHESKVQMLIYLTNALFKNAKHEKSLKFVDELGKSLEEYGGFLKSKFLIYYYTGQIINYSSIDLPKALESIESALSDKEIQKNKMNLLYLNLNKAQVLFDLKEIRLANKTLVRMKLIDAYNDLDQGLIFSLELFSIVLRIEMNDTEFAEKMIVDLKKKQSNIDERSSDFLAFCQALLLSHNKNADKDLKALAEDFCTHIDDSESQERDLINLNVWVKSQVN